MLLELHIRNFALIEKLEIGFSSGLNILTGETGAGKSIIIDSVNFLLGEKQGRDIIRHGEETAYVEGIFDCSSEEITDMLSEIGIESDECIIISRELGQTGRTVSRINGKAVTTGFLKELSKNLIDIHGQHEHQSLLDERSHIDILDSFGAEAISSAKNEYRTVYRKFKDIEEKIKEIEINENERLKKIDLLGYQINEIDAAKLKSDEYDNLINRRDFLSNAEKIYSSLSSACGLLYESEEGLSAYDMIGTSAANIETVSKYDTRIAAAHEELMDIYYKLNDASSTLKDVLEGIEYDSDELNSIEERIDIIDKLRRKYGNTIEEILKYRDSIENEYENLQNSEEMLETLNRSREDIKNALLRSGEKLSGLRSVQAEKLEKLIQKELTYLGMEKAVFSIPVIKKEEFGFNGFDNVRFLFSANPGEEKKPLAKIASGGEMSRIMLAVKSVIAEIDSIPTMIFDEIDTGVSGKAAQAVGEKMTAISKNHQILCVTHLPQIASLADCHFRIEKETDGNTTFTRLKKLTKDDRVLEIARIIGGAKITDITKKHAEEMIDIAAERKKLIGKS